MKAAAGGHWRGVGKERAVLGSFRSDVVLVWVSWALCEAYPYDSYDLADFKVPVGVTGDSYDRYMILLE